MITGWQGRFSSSLLDNGFGALVVHTIYTTWAAKSSRDSGCRWRRHLSLVAHHH
jgi:hypothetical protein